MKIIEVSDYEDMSVQAASYFIHKIRNFPTITLGLATGGTPKGMYRNMIEDHRLHQTCYRNVTTFNLDEYIGLADGSNHSYRTFMNETLFQHLNIQLSNTHFPAEDAQIESAERNSYDQLIKKHGGIDVQLLGIGENGHIGFNEPGAPFKSRTRTVQLADSTRQNNARYFTELETVPTHAITMGIATIMDSKEIVLLASGSAKKAALSKLLEGTITEAFPASVLHTHPNVTVFADKTALG